MKNEMRNEITHKVTSWYLPIAIDTEFSTVRITLAQGG